jgi:hypothetical protein
MLNDPKDQTDTHSKQEIVLNRKMMENLWRHMVSVGREQKRRSKKNHLLNLSKFKSNFSAPLAVDIVSSVIELYRKINLDGSRERKGSFKS